MSAARRKRHQRKDTLESWATNILLQAHAIEPCPDHGYMRLKFDYAAIDHAHAIAEHRPYRGRSKATCVAVIDELLDNLADTCPAC